MQRTLFLLNGFGTPFPYFFEDRNPNFYEYKQAPRLVHYLKKYELQRQGREDRHVSVVANAFYKPHSIDPGLPNPFMSSVEPTFRNGTRHVRNDLSRAITFN